ncbi:MAG: four-carbon acid sugar kinase family protein, partial [Rhabdaerophilum sp.]
MAPVITFYGDDFTGSSAVMEVLAFAGLPSIMFLDVPSPAMLARIEGMAAIGIAGISRSKPPEWMDAELPRVFSALTRLGAPILHYKTCSTFDSAPHLGSIGRAIEIGLAETGAGFAPLVVGAPAIGRYQMFGNLFAALDGIGYRLDRHPVMSRHPATPMHEADLCRHLEGQTSLASAVVDWRVLMAGQGAD